MTDAVKLKPCPFCNGEPTLHQPCQGLGAWISCAQCGLEGPTETGVTDVDATRHWNTRAEPAPAPDAVKIEPVGYYDGLSTYDADGIDVFAVSKLSKENFLHALYGQNAMDRIKELESVLSFVALWCWREPPAHATGPLTVDERFSVIRHHPTIEATRRALTGVQKDG